VSIQKTEMLVSIQPLSVVAKCDILSIYLFKNSHDKVPKLERLRRNSVDLSIIACGEMMVFKAFGL
jgi:hypothetical protein